MRVLALGDEEVSLTPYSPICTFCAHLRKEPYRTCDAFPGGIPREIWLGEHDHKSPFPGDGGIQFEQQEVSNG